MGEEKPAVLANARRSALVESPPGGTSCTSNCSWSTPHTKWDNLDEYCLWSVNWLCVVKMIQTLYFHIDI